MQIVVCESAKEVSEWERYVQRCPAATAFHGWAWRDITRKVYGHPSFYLMAKQGEDVSGILPLILVKGPFFGTSLVSMPFADYGGICADTPEACRQLAEAATELGRRLRVDYVELRQLAPLELGLPSCLDKVTMVLDLPPDEKQMWNRLPSERRSRVRKAINDKLTAEICSEDGLDAFYEVFAEHMRDLGSPVHGKAFFKVLLDLLPGSAKVVLVRYMGKVIAGGICLLFKESLLLPWHSASNTYRRLHPNVLLYWEAMKYGIAQGAREFDFGRSSKGSGTFEFKRNWGATPRQLHWQYVLLNQEHVPHLSADNPRYHLLIELWKRFPVSLSKRLGPVIRKSISA
jgi:FemAB-related protein (PEP-CTERM system-associated)